MDIVKVTIEGTAPLLMHNSRLANPLDEYARQLKAITAKRQKTDQDYHDMARIEFLGGLYHDKKVGVYIPGDNVAAMVRDGAKLKKRGASVQRGVECMDMYCPLDYEGPRDPQALWDVGSFRDIRSTKNGSTGGRTPRCRPVFNSWSVTFRLFYELEVINIGDLLQCVADAGTYIGIGDYRPGSPHGGRFGRFKITEWEAVNG